MATVKKVFIFGTTFLSGIAVLFTIVCLATEQWIYSDKIELADNHFNRVKYGLFQGTYKQVFPAPATVQITMTCLGKENVCALLCANSTARRYSILKHLYDGIPDDQDTKYCPQVTTYQVYNTHTIQEISFTNNSDSTSNKMYINCGIWVSTILFLVISITSGFISCMISWYNIVANPVQVYLSVYSLFVYISVACCSNLIAIILWGVHYHTNIFHNVAIYFTLNGIMSSDKTASLGYSYWLNLVPITLYICCICLLDIRLYLISKDPKQKIVQREEYGDPIIYLY